MTTGSRTVVLLRDVYKCMQYSCYPYQYFITKFVVESAAVAVAVAFMIVASFH